MPLNISTKLQSAYGAEKSFYGQQKSNEVVMKTVKEKSEKIVLMLVHFAQDIVRGFMENTYKY